MPLYTLTSGEQESFQTALDLYITRKSSRFICQWVPERRASYGKSPTAECAETTSRDQYRSWRRAADHRLQLQQGLVVRPLQTERWRITLSRRINKKKFWGVSWKFRSSTSSSSVLMAADSRLGGSDWERPVTEPESSLTNEVVAVSARAHRPRRDVGTAGVSMSDMYRLARDRFSTCID